MATLENLVNSIVAHSGSQSDLNQLLTLLRGQAEGVCQANLNSIPAAVQTLDIVHHSLGVLFLLEGQAKGLHGQADAGFIEHTSRFLRECAALQIQLAPDTFCSLCRRYKDHLVACGQPRVGILPLLSALQRLQPSPEHLTPIHADFLQLCLLSKCYSAALPVLEQDIITVDPQRTTLTPTDFQLYCYYGGLACVGRKQYARALELLVQSLTAPTSVGSAITVAAYKQYVLVSLIHTGSVPQLPKFTPSKVRQVVENEGRPYQDLAQAYASHNSERLRKTREHHLQTYNNDNNMGLVNLVQRSAVVRAVQRLTSTYLTLSLADIAKAAGLPNAAEAEMFMLRMIASGDIFARISERDGMVTFLEDPEGYNSGATAARIDSAIRRSMALSDKLQAVHEAVCVDRAYLSKTMKMERSHYMGPEELAIAGMMQPRHRQIDERPSPAMRAAAAAAAAAAANETMAFDSD